MGDYPWSHCLGWVGDGCWWGEQVRAPTDRALALSSRLNSVRDAPVHLTPRESVLWNKYLALVFYPQQSCASLAFDVNSMPPARPSQTGPSPPHLTSSRSYWRQAWGWELNGLLHFACASSSLFSPSPPKPVYSLLDWHCLWVLH